MRHLVTLILLIFGFSSTAQNLINNGSFENHTTCPDGFLQFVPNWQSNPFGGVHVFDICTSDVYWSVPVNSDSLLGYQFPHSGNAYAGTNIFYSDTLFRVYLTQELDSPLIQGMFYCLKFYVSLLNYSHYGIDAIGALFSDTLVTSPSPLFLINANPQVSNPAGNIILDTLGWTEIKGCFQATGEERYLVIGNFKPDSLVQKAFNSYNGYNWATYYYIDDVSLYLDSTQSINDKSWSERVVFYPNPASTTIHIKIPEFSGAVNFELYDLLGNLSFHDQIHTAQTSMDISELPSGFYTYRLISSTGKSAFGKLVLAKQNK